MVLFCHCFGHSKRPRHPEVATEAGIRNTESKQTVIEKKIFILCLRHAVRPSLDVYGQLVFRHRCTRLLAITD